MMKTDEAMTSSYLEPNQRRLILFYSFFSITEKILRIN